jgi:hypothetical protein
MWDPYSQFESIVLANGLTVYNIHVPHLAWHTVTCIIHTGGALDPIGDEGLAHFAEHLRFETGNFPGGTREELSTLAKNLGGHVMMGSTGPTSVKYTFKMPIGQPFKKMLTLFGETETHPSQGILANSRSSVKITTYGNQTKLYQPREIHRSTRNYQRRKISSRSRSRTELSPVIN